MIACLTTMTYDSYDLWRINFSQPRCEMGNRAVEMMVDTGAQTSAESLAKPPVLLVDTADIETCSLR